MEDMSPNRLKLGNPDNPQCATLVTVLHPAQACQELDCNTKAFFSEVIPIQPGQRAIHLQPCGQEDAPAKLLSDREARFDSTNILVLQDSRFESDLWEQGQTRRGHYTLFFGTEASDGTLSLSSKGESQWMESPP